MNIWKEQPAFKETDLNPGCKRVTVGRFIVDLNPGEQTPTADQISKLLSPQKTITEAEMMVQKILENPAAFQALKVAIAK